VFLGNPAFAVNKNGVCLSLIPLSGRHFDHFLKVEGADVTGNLIKAVLHSKLPWIESVHLGVG
jgi:hypothetical protein